MGTPAELSCLGCERKIIASNVVESGVHTVGSAYGTTSDEENAAVFCTSCWDAMENWFLNKNIDEAIMMLISACSGTGFGGGSATSNRMSPVSELALFYNATSGGITGR